MPNSIQYASVFQTVLDNQAVAASVTGWMDANAGLVIYNGGKDIKIPKMSLDGLGDYNRTNGYDRGSVTVVYETKTMTQDRGKQFLLDAMDVNETNFAVTAAAVMGKFQREKVIPEVDAYRLSALATMAITADKAVTYSYTPEKATILDALKDAIAKVKEAGFIGQPMVIQISTAAMTAFEKALGSNNIKEEKFTAGGFDTRCAFLDGIPMIETPADRLYSAITLNTTAQGGGYKKAAGAKDINFTVMPALAPIGVNKQDKPKIFDPSVVQDHDAWKIDYRRYHDLWVMDSNIEAIAVNIKDAK